MWNPKERGFQTEYELFSRLLVIPAYRDSLGVEFNLPCDVKLPLHKIGILCYSHTLFGTFKLTRQV